MSVNERWITNSTMSESDKLMHERGVLDIKFRAAVQTLSQERVKDPPTRRILVKCVKELDELYERLVDKHSSYILAARVTLRR